MRISTCVLLAVASALAPVVAHTQALPTATQTFELSAFGGATGALTGIPPRYYPEDPQGRNLGITVGVNLALPYLSRFQPSVEVRGTYPVDKGSIAGLENVMGGLRIEHRFGRLRPYADFFYGRGRIVYQNGGYPSPGGQFIYLYTNSSVYSPGGGLDYDLTARLALKADFQYQRYATPVTLSGTTEAKALTLGVIYRFDFNHHLRYASTSLPRTAPPRYATAQQYLHRDDAPPPPPPPPAPQQP